MTTDRRKKRAARRERVRAFFSGVPSLTRFLIVSMTAIITYSAVLIWICVRRGIWIDTEFSRLWYGYWGSEIFLCSGLKVGKLIVTRGNPFTGQSGTTGTNSGSKGVG